MIGDIIEFEDLQKITGARRPAEVIAKLKEMGIPFKRAGRGKPFTTLQQLNDSFDTRTNRSRKKTNPEPVITVK